MVSVYVTTQGRANGRERSHIHGENVTRVQGGPFARRTLFVDMKFKVLSQYKLYLSATLISMSTKDCPRSDGPPCTSHFHV